MKLYAPDYRPTEVNQFPMSEVTASGAQWSYRVLNVSFPVSGDQSKIDHRVAPRARSIIWNRVELLGVFKEMDEEGLG